MCEGADQGQEFEDGGLVKPGGCWLVDAQSIAPAFYIRTPDGIDTEPD